MERKYIFTLEEVLEEMNCPNNYEIIELHEKADLNKFLTKRCLEKFIFKIDNNIDIPEAEKEVFTNMLLGIKENSSIEEVLEAVDYFIKSYDLQLM